MNFAQVLAKESVGNALDYLKNQGVPLHVTVRVLLGKNNLRMELSK